MWYILAGLVLVLTAGCDSDGLSGPGGGHPEDARAPAMDLVSGYRDDLATSPGDLSAAADLRPVFDLQPPPDFAVCSPGHLAFGRAISTPTMDFFAVQAYLTDFNEDGIQDLFVVSGAENPGGAHAFLLGQGDGTFVIASFAKDNLASFAAVVADFNGDRHMDVVLTDNDSMGGHGIGSKALLGDGKGGVAAARWSFPAGLVVGSALHPADFNGDRRVDIFAGTILQLGNGDGTFNAVAIGNGAQAASPSAVADFDGDGNQDLAYVLSLSKQVLFLAGDGKGGFKPAVTLTPAPAARLLSLLAVDVNSDGRMDLVGGTQASVHSFVNLGGWTFNEKVTQGVMQGGPDPVSADFDNDGKPDLAVGPFNSPEVDFWTGLGDGTFAAGPTIPLGRDMLTAVTAGLVDSDCRPDLVVGTVNHQLLVIMNASW